ncbi:MAG TPA: hypothetical protein VFA59_23665 [Vicinamibacterales bacterium]|nr:hypothetical protein [Vicinamibacterales bacterium]
MIFWFIVVVASFLDIASMWVLRHVELGTIARVAVALSPVPGNVLIVGLVVRQIRRLDEFQKRLHFEAVVIAFLLTGVSVFVYGYLETAQAVPRMDLMFIWAFMGISYVVGYAISCRQYR